MGGGASCQFVTESMDRPNAAKTNTLRVANNPLSLHFFSIELCGCVRSVVGRIGNTFKRKDKVNFKMGLQSTSDLKKRPVACQIDNVDLAWSSDLEKNKRDGYAPFFFRQ